MPNARAAKKCAEWLAFCRSLGWPAEWMPRLADLWWEFHDDNGELRRTDVTSVPHTKE